MRNPNWASRLVVYEHYYALASEYASANQTVQSTSLKKLKRSCIVWFVGLLIIQALLLLYLIEKHEFSLVFSALWADYAWIVPLFIGAVCIGCYYYLKKDYQKTKEIVDNPRYKGCAQFIPLVKAYNQFFGQIAKFDKHIVELNEATIAAMDRVYKNLKMIGDELALVYADYDRIWQLHELMEKDLAFLEFLPQKSD